jgi:hypothetical protein
VEIVGLMGGALVAAASVRLLRGTSILYGLPVALAFLKLPTGAISAVLGVLVLRAQLLIGLPIPSSSAQILAAALLFGCGQQIVTRLVDEFGGELLVGGDFEPSSLRASDIVANWFSALRKSSN